ncbi:MAG: peptidylprolyl isomerase [Paludibacteraceae bacterium]|jgi:peptidyl-prolyl cis-trans isomerase SurA|nr:peptidylprolyl isomerase [Paludibacteraceae bacterium]MBO5863851.1 peptidylprolyl isomerase [Paludibacteraceae bacterium]MBQ1970614.1 peptidylprolyl isomerase [Paludibacteraceae bacterium]MEE0997281.1 peptidylprolyl isomerase [Paludibacteraceae bacterium]
MTRKFISGIAAILFSVLAVSGQESVIDEIVWVVGDEAILRSDVEEQRMRFQYEGTKVEGDPYCFIPEQLALQKLFLDQAKIDSVYADEASVSSQVDMRINYLISQVGSKEKLEEYFGKPLHALKEELREMVKNQQIVQQMQKKIVGDVKCTPAEIRRFVSKIPQDSIPTIPTQVEVQILIVEPKVSKEAIEEVKSRLREFRTRVESGESEFSTLAILYSEDTESAKRGGEIGFMGKGQLVPEYADVAFAMQDKKKLSKIVESEFGFHLIQLIDKSGDRVNTRHILMKPRPSLSEKDMAAKRLDSIADVVRKEVMNFDQAVSFYSSDKNTRNSFGLLTNPKSGDSKFQMQDLPQEVAKVVYGMNVGEISKPFSMIGSNGKEVFAIVKLKSKTLPHKANMTDDFVLMKNIYQQKKSADKLNDWIREKQKDIYVRIDPKWRNCEFQYPGWIKE